jgi:uncharacterized protein (DUF1330 family)
LEIHDMPAYLIADIEIHDAVAYEEYKRIVPESVARHGGRFLIRGGAVDSKEGGWNPRRLTVIEFPTMEQARRFYDSPEYAPALAIRLKASNARLVLADGV